MARHDGLVIVTFKIPMSDLQKLDEYCHKMNVTRSEVIREAIKTYLKNMENVQNEHPIRVKYIRLGDGNRDRSDEVVKWAFKSY